VNGGNLIVSSGGVASGSEVSFALLSVGVGGSAVGTIVSNGAALIDGGSASGTVVLSGGAAIISGSDTGTIVQNAGVTGGGVAYVESGGVEYAVAGSPVIGVTLVGGAEFVSSGGTASQTTVAFGSMTVLASGTALTRLWRPAATRRFTGPTSTASSPAT
jgi:autotransporter passenger strand-loop-strand repeat protein